MEFNTIGTGASSVVRALLRECTKPAHDQYAPEQVKKAVHVPTHRFLALKTIAIIDKDKRSQMMTEIRTLCTIPREVRGLVSFHGAFYKQDTNQISIGLEHMDGGSIEGALKRLGRVPEPVLAAMGGALVEGLGFLHTRLRKVHRDIKPAGGLACDSEKASAWSLRLQRMCLPPVARLNEGRDFMPRSVERR
jgi:serine/threonine protein kinase